MTLLTRRILYTSATILFAAVAPAVIFYAQGYRFDPGSARILKTGAIRFQTWPRTLQVNIDGKEFRRTNPSLLRNLLPGDYAVTLRADGYQVWSGKVKISANSVSVLEADLIRSDPDRFSLAFERVVATAFNSTKNALAIVSSQGTETSVGVLEMDKAVFRHLARISGQSLDEVVIAWSSRGKFLALNKSGGALILIKPDDGAAIPLPDGADWSFEKVVWDPANDNLLYGLDDESVWQIDVFAKTARVVASPNIVDIGFDHSSLWVVRSQGETRQLQLLDPFGQNSVNRQYESNQAISGLLAVSNNRFLVQSGDQVMALDAETQTLRSITLPSIGQTIMSRDSERALLVGGQEVWMADLSALTLSLIGRYADLNGAGWAPSEDTVLLSANSSLFAISLSYPAAEAGSLTGLAPDAERLLLLNQNDAAIIGRSSVVVLKLF